MTINLSTILDVAISLVFVYFTLSIFVSGIVELINSLIDKRARLLKFALEKVLGHQAAADFWNHPLIQVKEYTSRRFFQYAPVSYLSADSFSTVIIALVTQVPPTTPLTATQPQERTLEHLRQAIQNPRFERLRAFLEPLLAKVDTLKAFKEDLDRWYDGYMEQVSGWFKNHVRLVIWGVSIAVTLLFNIDTILITRRIFMDKNLRANLVEQAQATARQEQVKGFYTRQLVNGRTQLIPRDKAFVAYIYSVENDSSLIRSIASPAALSGLDSLRVRDLYVQYMQAKMEALGLPIGWVFPADAAFGAKWSHFWRTFASWSLVGWLLTTAALSFGAPFWFDVLLKLVNIRNVSRRPKPVRNFIEGAD